jgi:hypothetical protein
MGRYLTTASTVLCPHGAPVVGVASQSEETQDGYPLLSTTDTFIVTGCPFVDGDGQPSPCLQVTWTTSSSLPVGLSGGHAIEDSSVGIALDGDAAPQGSVTVVSA